MISYKPFLWLNILTITSNIARSLGCLKKTTSCDNIKTASGYKYPLMCDDGTEVYVQTNNIVAAHADQVNEKYTFSPDVVSMDASSIVTEQCRDINILCVVNKGDFAEENCVDIEVFWNSTQSEIVAVPGLLKSRDHTIVFAVVGILILCVILLLCSFLKNYSKKQKSRATFTGVLSYLLSVCNHKKGNSTADRGERRETSLCQLPTSTDPNGNVENYNDGELVKTKDEDEDDNTLTSVHVDSADMKADDKNLLNLSQQQPCNIGNKVTQPTKIFRNVRHDPGGVNPTTGNKVLRNVETANGCTVGPSGLQEPLLPLDFDRMGEATHVALVNKHSFDPDQINMCRTAPDTDVESTSELKKN